MSISRAIKRNIIRQQLIKDGRRKIHKCDGRYKTYKGESESLLARVFHKIRGVLPGKVKQMRMIRAMRKMLKESQA